MNLDLRASREIAFNSFYELRDLLLFGETQASRGLSPFSAGSATWQYSLVIMLIQPCFELSEAEVIQLQRRFSSERSPSTSCPNCACKTSDSMSDGDINLEPIDPNLTPEEANRIIHSHRKVRYGELQFLDFPSRKYPSSSPSIKFTC